MIDKKVVHLLEAHMKYVKYIKQLANSFVKGNKEETTIQQLAEMFECSERHAKTIINYLDREKFVNWEIQRGRGKKPKLLLNYSYEEILLEEAKHDIKQEKYQEAFSIVEDMEKNLQEEFQAWLNNYLGIVERVDATQEIDILRYPFYETKLKMDPLLISSRHDGHMVQQVFNRLVEFDGSTLRPSIAHHFESEDGIRWTFYLRKGVLFHHGRELQSSDVKATFDRFPSTNSFMRNVQEIACVSDYVITFQLMEIDYMFPRYLSNIAASIIPIEMMEKDERKFRDFPIGSGPFKLTEHDGEKIRLEVFENYFDLRPWLDRVEIIKTPTSLQQEETHPLLLSAPNTSWEEVETMEEGADFVVFNCTKNGPIQDRKIRAQIIESINPDAISLEGEIVAHSFHTKVSVQKEAFTAKDSTNRHSIDINAELVIGAQQIRNGVNHEREALILKEQLAEVGIASRIEIVNTSDFHKSEVMNQFDLIVSGIALSVDRLLSALIAITSKQLAISHCLTEDMQEVILKQERRLKETIDEGKRWKIYFEMEEYLQEQDMLIFLNHRSHNIYKPRSSPYMNIELDSNGRIDYRKVWKREG